jgi:hypothetical protein
MSYGKVILNAIMCCGGALTQRMRPIAVGRITEAMIPAAAASIPLPGHVDNCRAPTEEVAKAADADVAID